jgi:hypothetical protein
VGYAAELFGSEWGPGTSFKPGNETLGSMKGRHQKRLYCLVFMCPSEFGVSQEENVWNTALWFD